MYDPFRFGEKYLLAVETAQKEDPLGGLCGFELEWNLLDTQLRPLLTVGSGQSELSFVDYLRADALPAWVREFSQLEVFHWMIEWATRPYYHARGAVYEARLLEGMMLNGLSKAGRHFNTELFAWHGNLLYKIDIDHKSIPGSWHLAKRRYLERCVDMYGEALATAGTHTNLSLPAPLLAWDFIHLTPSERGDLQFEDYKNNFYITATRLMRAFASLFIACSASTPLQAQVREGKPVVVLTEIDSVRNLTFPNPDNIDLPGLYRSYTDYLQISNDLVLSGTRFGNNNWTPVRARSFAEPVERLISTTSEQLEHIYSRGLYILDAAHTQDEIASQIEKQNLLARIHLPMSRVEVRTDDGCHPVEIDLANITLKQLLLDRFYADNQFGRSFQYDRKDIHRARRNEQRAAQEGLRAEIENPFSGKPVQMRDFLRWTLEEVRPLAIVLGVWDDLLPLIQMAEGDPNTSESIRSKLKAEMGNTDLVPMELLRLLPQERMSQVARDVENIAENYFLLAGENFKLSEFFQRARADVHADPQAPVPFRPSMQSLIEVSYPDVTSEIMELAKELIRIPSVTACPQEQIEEVRRAATFIYDYAKFRGLGVRYYYQEKYPALLIGFPEQMHAPVMLSGHFDVVLPDPDNRQFEPRVDGNYLWGRGAADMKTVVATYLVWMKDVLRKGPPYPPINLLLVGNEENGEGEAMGTPHVLRLQSEEEGYQPKLFIAGERTGENGDELWGEICVENRGVLRFNVIAHAQRGHTGVLKFKDDLTQRMLEAQDEISSILNQRLTMVGMNGWQSQVMFPFIQVGTPGVYNISADQGILGIEVRPIPQDNIDIVLKAISAFCDDQNLILDIQVHEDGIVCDRNNPYLVTLIESVRSISGREPRIGKKLPGTSARFAPGGQGIVWGQSGADPHGKGERHYIPSIAPYYQVLSEFGQKLSQIVDL